MSRAVDWTVRRPAAELDSLLSLASTTGLLSLRIALAVLILGAPQKGSAQQDEPTCARCRIELRRVVAIGDNNRGLVGEHVSTVELDGRYYVSTVASPDRIQVFDSDGSFLNYIGRRGEGPGEFLFIQDIEVGPDGNIWVFDDRPYITVYQPDGTLVSTVQVPWGGLTLNGVELLPDTTILINGVIPTPNGVGRWVHAWHPTSGILWSLADDQELYRRNTELRPLAVDGEGVWVAWGFDRYEVSRYVDGHLQRRLRPTRTWFEDYKVQPPPRGGSNDDMSVVWRPKARIWDIHVTNNILWVIGSTADPRWRESRVDGWYNASRYIDSIIEAFDVRTGALLASRRVDDEVSFFESFIDDGLLAGVELYEYGATVSVWEVNLVR